MAQYLDNSTPEYVPQTPIFINGVKFDPAFCIVHGNPDDGGPPIEHTCVHDWGRYWGNQKRPQV